MKRKFRILIIIGFVLAFLAACNQSSSASSSTVDTIKIGIITDLSGPGAVNAAELAVEEN